MVQQLLQKWNFKHEREFFIGKHTLSNNKVQDLGKFFKVYISSQRDFEATLLSGEKSNFITLLKQFAETVHSL